MKRQINAFEYAPHVMEQLKSRGILATVKLDGKVNPITIGWGTIGIQWGKPLFQIYIRESRYTKSMLDKAREFTLNIPLEMNDRAKEILAFCGTKSGRDTDKCASLGLTLETGEQVSAPAIRELPLTIECRVIYSERQNGEKMPAEILQRYYPQWAEDPKDVHTVFYGEILTSYILE